MTTTRRVRPVRTPGFGRILAAALVLSALLAAAPSPVQASPLPGDGGPLASLLSWLEGLLAGIGFSPEVSDGPEAAFLPDGGLADPIGGSQDLTAPVNQPQLMTKGLVDDRSTSK